MFFSSRLYLTVLFFSMCFFSGKAQNKITTTNILLGAYNAEQVKYDSIQLAFLEGYNHNLPILDNLEFRTETRDLRLRRQEYAIRFKPNTLRGRIANKKLYKSKLNDVQIQSRIKVFEELEDRYFLLVDYFFNKKLIEAYKYQKILLNDKITVLKPSIYTEKFNVNDLISAEEAIFENQIILNNLIKTQEFHYAILQIMINNNKDNIIESDDLITPSQIIISGLYQNSAEKNLNIQRKQLELESIEGEMLVDVAKSKKIIDFFQVKYGGKNSDFFDENFAIGLGINLPFFGEKRKIKSDYYFKKLNTEREIASLKKEKEKEVNEFEDNFNKTAKNYQVFRESIKNSSVSSLLDVYKKIEGISPLILLKLKMSEHKKNIEFIKIEKELYEAYIETLSSKNILFRTPFRNFLIEKNPSLD